jgi:hypothetical protein
MKFDIYNRTTKQPENGVYSDNVNILKQLYAMNGEDIEIVKAYKEEPQNDLTPEDQTVRNKLLGGTEAPVRIPIDNKQSINDVVLPLTLAQGGYANVSEKIFTDNGVEYKVNADGSFKKSWVDVDQDNFRIVDIETGKESKLKSKKIQTLDWVKIG